MRVLLTGTSGQVGRALLTRLNQNHTVIAPLRDAFDLSSPKALISQLDGLKPDLIINPAAYTSVDIAEDEPERAFAINRDAPETIAEWAAPRAVPLIHFSTDYVFDGSGDRAWQEDDKTGPLSVYGESKRAGELAIQSAGGPHLIVRTAWVYAAEGSNFLRTIMRLATERDVLRVVADQIGTPTSASTIADVVGQVVGRSKETLPDHFKTAGGLIHVTNSGFASWFDFASEIVSQLRKSGQSLTVRSVEPIATSEYPTKAVRPANSRLDLTRLKEVFGITPEPWQTALKAEVALVARSTR